MPGGIFAKIRRTGYLGQVVTAGILLTIAAVLMFAVISTLQPVIEPPTAKMAPVSETGPQAQKGAANNLPATTVVITAPSPTQPASTALPAGEAVSSESSEIVGEQTISELWSGAITHKFGWQLHPQYQDWRYHNGVDIAGGEGQIVPALANGEVVEIFTDKQYGLTVAVKSDKYIIYYGSLASVAVQLNTIIKTGKPLGSMGITLAEPEPHLHLAVQGPDKKEYLNPHEVFSGIAE